MEHYLEGLRKKVKALEERLAEMKKKEWTSSKGRDEP